MEQLIKITTNEQGSQVVSARELYAFLGFDSANWKRWATKNIEENYFSIENQDWVGFFIMKNGNQTKDYALSIDFSKRLAQMARTAKGEEIRNYFIACEKQLPMSRLKNNVTKIHHINVEIEQNKKQIEALKERNKDLANEKARIEFDNSNQLNLFNFAVINENSSMKIIAG
jgi:phage anti-repressor protein